MAPDDDVPVEEEAADRQHERAETVEQILSDVREDLGDQRYPVSSEDLAARYANTPIDLMNETESLGSALDRIDTSFEDEQEAYEALATQFMEGEHTDIRSDAIADEPPYWEKERAATQQPAEPDGSDYDNTVAQSKRRAREAEAEAAEEDAERDEERTRERENSTE